ncbi:hypothetical protein RDI58_019812 [Solanum bulbocastanum]
MQRNI